MVMVGGIWMKRSRMVVADCETLPAAPVVNACEPLVEITPPPWVISPAPAITPKRNRSPEDFEVVIVDLVFQALFADLVEAVELVEIDASSRPA